MKTMHGMNNEDLLTRQWGLWYPDWCC